MAVSDALSARDLRWIADSYDQAQRVRLQAGERIRAVVQGRDGRTGLPISDAREQLKRILQGKTDGPVPLLGRTYRRHWEAERELRSAMEEALRAHVVWPWLSALRGIGVTLAARLLARLDIHRAPTPSSFWAYCGLATVPAQLYRCAACGVTSASASGRAVRVRHRTPNGEACAGQFAAVEVHGSVRVAQPGP
ncbi:MAG TPA: transposase, partial [Longimicrobiales bacterium]|nr:transposase [Longimicrobiales bacterium]